MNGFLIANKPRGITSSSLVIFVRKRLPRGTAVGHGGTLDPEASGVLPICVGSATRLFDYIIDKKKSYIAEIRLGIQTDTQDATGQIVSEKPVCVGEAELKAVLAEFIGEIEQIPPMYSAIKRDGKRMYELARKGESVALEARSCRIDGIELLGRSGEHSYKLRVACGKGVYIRTLCHDIGARLGCGAHMLSLMRTEAGTFDIENALTREQIDELYRVGALGTALLPLDAPLKHYPQLHLSEEARHAVVNGNALKPIWMNRRVCAGEIVRIYLGESFAGMGEGQPDGTVRFRAMLLSEEEKRAYLEQRRRI